MFRKAEKLSTTSQSARHQIGIAISLITIIPLLAIAYLILKENTTADTNIFWQNAIVIAALLTSVAFGYISLSVYPLNIARLRRYLQNIVDGKALDQVALLQGMDDIPAIENSLKMIVDQLSQQVAQLEKEVDKRKRAEHLKDDFVSTVSHELRTPLAICKEGINLLLDGIPGEINDKQRKVLSTSGRNVERLARIINDLLDISKIEAGKMEIKKTETDFGDLLTQTAASMEPLAAKKNLSVELRKPAEPLMVFVDPDRIVQVLTNLVGNAIKFTQTGGITITCERDDESMICHITDTGPGLAQEDLPRIFDKFSQFDRTDGAGAKGTGLGLAIVRRLLELHSGQITVSSELGQGTIFRFSLPLYGPEKVLMARLDERLTQAQATQRTPTLAVIEISMAPSTDPTTWAEAFQKRYAEIQKSGALIHDNDCMCSRDTHQIIILGDIHDEFRDEVCDRWRRRIQECFADLPADFGIGVSYAYATFTEHGGTAKDLLLHIQEQLATDRNTNNAVTGGDDEENKDHLTG